MFADRIVFVLSKYGQTVAAIEKRVCIILHLPILNPAIDLMNLRSLLSLILIIISLTGMRAAPVVDSVAAVASVCSNNGKLIVYAHGTGPLTYTIVSGPVTHGAQSSDMFSALAPGTYTIQVSDGAGTVTVTRTVTGGTYVPPSFTPYVVYPLCKQSHDFLLIGHLDPGTGAGPVIWQMSAPVNTAYQNSDTFHIQEPGSYTISCADVCGSIQTTTYTFAYDFVPNILPGVITENLIGCDSVSIDLSASVNGTDQNVVFPYTLSLHSSRGPTRTFTQTAPVHRWFCELCRDRRLYRYDLYYTPSPWRYHICHDDRRVSRYDQRYDHDTDSRQCRDL